MKALQFNVSVARYVLCKMFGKLSKAVTYSRPFSMLHYVDIPEPLDHWFLEDFEDLLPATQK